MFYCSVLSTLQSLRLINVIDLVNVDNTNISYNIGVDFLAKFSKTESYIMPCCRAYLIIVI